jgi:hypothetical protein
VLKKHIEAGYDGLRTQIKEITTTKRSMHISPAGAYVPVNAKIRKSSESKIGGELAKIA